MGCLLALIILCVLLLIIAPGVIKIAAGVAIGILVVMAVFAARYES